MAQGTVEDIAGRIFRGVHFIDDSTGWVVGGERAITSVHKEKNVGYRGRGFILQTTDGGKSWRRPPGTEGLLTCEMCPGLLNVHFVDEKTGWVLGALGTAFSTSDGGESWTRRPGVAEVDGGGSNPTAGLWSFDADTAIACTNSGIEKHEPGFF